MKILHRILLFSTFAVFICLPAHSNAQSKKPSKTSSTGKPSAKAPVESKWQEFAVKDKGFSVLFPSKPAENISTVVSPDWGKLPLYSYAYDGGDVAYIVLFGRTPLQELKSLPECVLILRRNYVRGDEIVSYKETSKNGLASIEWIARNPYGNNQNLLLFGQATINPSKGQLWVVNFGAKDQGTFDKYVKERQKFVGSMKLTP